jgi:hypothetical protein
MFSNESGNPIAAAHSHCHKAVSDSRHFAVQLCKTHFGAFATFVAEDQRRPGIAVREHVLGEIQASRREESRLGHSLTSLQRGTLAPIRLHIRE